MKSTVKSLVLTGVIVILCGSALAFYWKSSAKGVSQERVEQSRDKGVPREGKYEVSTVLQLDYGEGENQVGLISGIEDFRPLGPMSFAVENGAVYVLDRVNEQVKIFDFSGKPIRSIRTSDAPEDIIVDSQDNVYVLDNGEGALIEYMAPLYVPIKHSLEQSAAKLLIDQDGDVVARVIGEDSYAYKVNKTSGKADLRAIKNAYVCRQVDDHNGAVINARTGRKFNVPTEDTFGSISYLGQDRQQNIFVVVEQLLPSDTVLVKKEVRKYTPTGDLLATIPVDIDYAAHPMRELVLDQDGSVYHLRTMKDRMVVEKWSQQD